MMMFDTLLLLGAPIGMGLQLVDLLFYNGAHTKSVTPERFHKYIDMAADGWQRLFGTRS